MSSLPKPVLRGHIKRRGIKGVIGAICVGIFNGSLYHFFVGNPRRRAYEEFEKTYDAEAHFKELDKYGYLTHRKMAKEFKDS